MKFKLLADIPCLICIHVQHPGEYLYMNDFIHGSKKHCMFYVSLLLHIWWKLAQQNTNYVVYLCDDTSGPHLHQNVLLLTIVSTTWHHSVYLTPEPSRVLFLARFHQKTKTMRENKSSNDIINHIQQPAAVPSPGPFSWASTFSVLMYSSCQVHPPSPLSLHIIISSNWCSKHTYAQLHSHNV